MARNIGNPKNTPGDVRMNTPLGTSGERRRDLRDDETDIDRDIEVGPTSDDQPLVGQPMPGERPPHLGGVRGAWEDVKEGARDVVDDVRGATTRHVPVGSSSTPAKITREAVDKLNEFLRGELSGVETYDLALRKVRDPELSSALRQIRDNHDRRVTELRDMIRAAGGEPSQSSGAWGAFAKLVQAGADLFGDRSAISVLEEGEDHGLKMYREDIDTYPLEVRDFVLMRLLPEQQKTHDLCRSLERFMKAA